MPIVQGVLGSSPGGKWQLFRFVSLDIPYFKINFLPTNRLLSSIVINLPHLLLVCIVPQTQCPA